MKSAQWTRTDRELPKPESEVVWLSPSGEEIEGRYVGGVIWYPTGSSLYIYYRPAFWRYR